MGIVKPTFIVIGAMKAATTSLYTYLRQHPQIYMPDKKEILFFNNFQQKNNFKTLGKSKHSSMTLEEYFNFFSGAKDEIAIGEASPAYLYNIKSPELISEHLPGVKLIVILRHPTERAYSNFLHLRKSAREKFEDFEMAIDIEDKRINENWSPLYHYIRKGYYSQQLNRYYSRFPKENIKVILFEEFINNTEETLKDLFLFLNVNPLYNVDIQKKVNIGGLPKGIIGYFIKYLKYYDLIPEKISQYVPQFVKNNILQMAYAKPEKIDENLRRNITNKYYIEEINCLQKMIGKDLTHWIS